MRKALKIIVVLLVTLVFTYLGATQYLSYRISSFIEHEFLKAEVSLEEVNLNLLAGSISLHSVSTAPAKGFSSQIELFQITGLNYYELLINNHIEIDQVQISDFDLHLPWYQQSGTSKERKVTLKQLSLNRGKISKSKSDTVTMKFNGIASKIEQVTFNTADFRKTLDYNLLKVQVDSSFIKMNNSEDIKTGAIVMQPNTIQIADFMIKTNFETASKIKKEQINKDQLLLESSEILIDDYQFITYPELAFTSNKIAIDSTSFYVLANNNKSRTKTRVTYSKLLRELEFQIDIDTIQFKNAYLEYSEPNAANTKRGAITFESINATFVNFNNIEGQASIRVSTNSAFMGSKSLKTSFSLDPYDKNDAFEWSGEISSFDLSTMNSFLNPVLDMKLSGMVHKYYFSIYGDKAKNKVDIKINFDNARIEFTKKKLGINTLISDIANLFATNDSNNKLISKQVTIDRDKKASFFNQAWKVQRKALLEVLK